MSQADSAVACGQGSVRALWLVLGVRRVCWGAVLGRAYGARWECWGTVDIPEAGSGNRSALMRALSNLPEMPFSLAPAGARLHVWMDDFWVPMDMLPWGDALKDEGTALSSAREVLREHGHDVRHADRIRLDDMPWGQPRLAVAYPDEVIGWIEDQARRWSTALASVRVASIACRAAQERRTRKSALAVLLDDRLVLTGPTELRTIPLASDSPSRESGVELIRQIENGWARLVLRYPSWVTVTQVPLVNCQSSGDQLDEVPVPFALIHPMGSPTDSAQEPLGHVLVEQSLKARPHPLDAVADRRSTRVTLVSLAMVFCLGLMLLGLVAKRQFQVKELLAAAVSKHSATVSATNTATPLSKLELARVPAVNQAVRQLNLPVQALLHALEPPKDLMVAVLSVDSVGQGAPSGQASSIRIVAQTPNSADMTRYVAFVGDRRPFTGAYLRKHEWVDGASQKQVRFTVEATWND